MAWMQRRQERKATLRAARMLVALEGLSSARPKRRAVMRASVGAGR
jgi:hypothetical protein